MTKMYPFSFYWKKNKNGNNIVPDDEKLAKFGGSLITSSEFIFLFNDALRNIRISVQVSSSFKFIVSLILRRRVSLPSNRYCISKLEV